jgi:hypothetical protein
LEKPNRGACTRTGRTLNTSTEKNFRGSSASYGWSQKFAST